MMVSLGGGGRKQGIWVSKLPAFSTSLNMFLLGPLDPTCKIASRWTPNNFNQTAVFGEPNKQEDK